MSGLFEQKYKNNTRIISGLNNVVYQDDVVLQCDTTLNPVSLNLLSIPVQKWSTLYKLYVVDSGNNAAINNITINAPLGFLINGAASALILDNGGSYLIRVSSDTSYNGQYSNGSGVASNGHIIQDEGIDLPQRLRLNFTGGGVAAVDNIGQNRTDVSIISGIIDITNAALIALCNANTAIKGQLYKIIDCPLAEGVIVQAISTNQVSLQGIGSFYNADYQLVGDYSGVVGFVGAMGVWTITVQVVVAGNVVIYNNAHYVNLTGNWGAFPTGDAVNWAILPQTVTNGYIVETDEVRYDLANNYLLYRADKRGNEVERVEKGADNSLQRFQWGRDRVTMNKVFGNSLMLCTNSVNIFKGNILYSSNLYETPKSHTANGNISYNMLTNGSLMDVINIEGVISHNTLSDSSNIIISLSADINTAIRHNNLQGASKLNFDTMEGAEITSNQILSASQIIIDTCKGNVRESKFLLKGTLEVTTLNAVSVYKITVETLKVKIATISSSITAKTVNPNFSDFEATLDLNDVAIYNGGTKTLTIPNDYRSYVGVYKFLNATGNDIEVCADLPTDTFSVKFMPDFSVLPNSLQIVFTAIGAVGLGDFVADDTVATVGSTLLVAYAASSDYMIIDKKISTYNLVKSKFIHA